MAHSLIESGDISRLKYLITHVFCPLQLPNENDYSIHFDHSLASASLAAATLYRAHVSEAENIGWHRILRMLGNIQAITGSKSESTDLEGLEVASRLRSMDTGDVVAIFIRAQNAGVIFRRQQYSTVFESFEVSPTAQDVMSSEGKLICSYPGPAIEIPNFLFDNEDFSSELVSFLVHMNNEKIAKDPLHENQSDPGDTVHPRYITELLTGILRSVGHPADIRRISKRVGDDVRNNSKLPWRRWQRSSLWLFIRVVLQTSLERSLLGRRTYKEFMLFFMCSLATDKNYGYLPSDLLQFMSAKISRRLRKLQPSPPAWLSHTVLHTCTLLRSTIESRWSQVQATLCPSPSHALSQLDLTHDIQLSLLQSRNYLRSSVANNITILPDDPFIPGICPRGNLEDFLSSDDRFFKEAYHIDPRAALYDVEQAVERDIDSWVDTLIDNDDACMKLENLAVVYSSSATETYGNNPEQRSIMLLTMVELWIALDKIAIREVPILMDYSPELPTRLLEQLLFSRVSKLNRLRIAHEYIFCRHIQAQSRWSVFSSSTTVDNFAVRFYRQSLHLRRLKDGVRAAAPDRLLEMIAEFRKMNVEHPINDISSDQISFWDRVRGLLLPTDRLLTHIVLFELGCPISFKMWRISTLHLLFNFCSSYSEQDTLRNGIDAYRTLKQHFVKHPRPCNSLRSRIKSYVSHSEKPRAPTEQEWSCVKHGLRLFSFNTQIRTLVYQALNRCDSGEYCTYELPSGPYNNLQKYLRSTSHTSNDVVANQVECHEDLSNHEFIAFGHLRSGGSLQWLNILRELRARSLSFRRPEVHLLFSQAASQVGPLSNAGWKWHEEIRQPAFCYALLRELESLVRDIEANWLEGVTMDTISFLLRRVVDSMPGHPVSLEAVRLLRTVREKVFSWVQELSSEFARTPADENSQTVLRDTAAICRSTFDVEQALVTPLLDSVEDIEILLSSAIIHHRHIPRDISNLSRYSQMLIDRDRRLSLALEGLVRDILRTDIGDVGINLAIRRIWPDFQPASKWSPSSDSNSYWFSCTTNPGTGQLSQTVHLNILDGSLLIDGKPLGIWLPNEYTQHPLYKMIFGEQILQVLPGNRLGMEYTTRNLISNHQVYFTLRNNGLDLVIRATRKGSITSDSEIMELIPHEILKGDLPQVLIEGHAHWYNLSTSIIEIRPLESVWRTSSNDWKINCFADRYHMRRGNSHLLDIRSKSWDAISSFFSPLSSSQDLIISASPIDPSQPTSSLQLSVLLPRYDLSFYVDEDGDLQSHNNRGMVYDENQSVGTFFGLVNQLVLRPKNKGVNDLELLPRCVLIPDGDVSYQVNGHHVRVEINPYRSPLNWFTYQTYRVNAELGCLVGNATLTSKLYCAYLHAVTSGCGEDPLTGRPGVEEAVSVLRSAGCWTNVKFSARDEGLLGLIASICPSRTWQARQSVQKVEGCGLPETPQSYELYDLSKAIKECYQRVQSLYTSSSNDSFQNFPTQDPHLLKRGARRAALLAPGLSRQHLEANSDVRYRARDVMETSSTKHDVYRAAICICRKSSMSGSKETVDIREMMMNWKQDLAGDTGDTSLSLTYDKRWLTPDLPSIWLKAYNLLRNGDDRKWFQLLFSLPAMVYSSSSLAILVPVFVAFASSSRFRHEHPPHYDSYPFAKDSAPSAATLATFVFQYAYPFEQSPENRSGNPAETETLRLYDQRLRTDANKMARKLVDAWPCENPPPCSLNSRLYDIAEIELKVQRYFSDCFRNHQLEKHVARVQIILDDFARTQAAPPSDVLHLTYSFSPSNSAPPSAPWFPSINELFSRSPPLFSARGKLPQVRYANDSGHCSASLGNNTTSLRRLITMVESEGGNELQRRYISALRVSAECFRNGMFLEDGPPAEVPNTDVLVEHYIQCRANYVEALHRIRQHLGPIDKSEQTVERSGQWPRFTPHLLFRTLASNSEISLPTEWKRCIVNFTLLALELQRARRLVLLRFENLSEEFFKELRNEGCDGWDAETHPDWLLIQLQGNFLIRRIQADVANEMISPRSGENTAMQLNMGEGKTSVIIPIAAAVLANGEQLVRVIVPKPLRGQTLDTLTDRLGGLTNRRIYYLPFSRFINVDWPRVAALRDTMLECMRMRGILVLQPDHVLSFKLVAIEKQLSVGVDEEASYLILQLQKWLHFRSRDILDESDEILDVRSQLSFTIGEQQQVEGSPERWTTTQQVLSLVSKHVPSLQDQFPLGVDYEPGPPGSFPYFRILQTKAGEKLVSYVVQDVIDGLLPNVSFAHLHYHPGLDDAIRSFISREDVPPGYAKSVKEYFGRTSLWGGLLLLRGLFATGILLYTLKERRWRVDYGLCPARTMLAVPYRAKDFPTQTTEFSHPDIAIVLTCLSYYYAGLTEEQLRQSFHILFEKQVPSFDYELWVRACPSVPEFLRSITGININSLKQWREHVFPLFSRNQATIDFYLLNVVFPKEIKVCPSKLSSSGWDLAEKKRRLVTGFSGTNDGQYLLPLHIAQCDPDHQRGTNARVLSYLLQPENNHYMCMAHSNEKRRTTREFLQIIVTRKPEIRVLLDVGAQMLDLRNNELAEAWLDIHTNAAAAIYFNDSDELTVRTRDSNTQPLRSSPFAQQLDRCVIYLDDAHTRGTDIKFPDGFRAAVTLGPKVTKDRLAQGCMRMRKLGHGHSVMFFAPLEVDRRIRAVSGKSDAIDTTDILHWTIRETWECIQRWAPHWVQQGTDHRSRYTAWSNFCARLLPAQDLSKDWLQPEAKTLEALYEPHRPPDPSLVASPDISQRWNDLGMLSLSTVGMAEEQERELAYEVKREQEVTVRPPIVAPVTHSVHQDVIEFVRTGVIPTKTQHIKESPRAFRAAFDALDGTRAATDEAYIWSQYLMITTDFEKTIQASEKTDDYLRPVQWIVSAKKGHGDVFVILSPYEVDYLLSDIRSSDKVQLHLYTPRITKLMKPCDDLALYSIPTLSDRCIPPCPLVDQLNIFAGQLYLKDYDTYIRLCRFLGVYARDLEGVEGIIMEPDGFILPQNRNRIKEARTEIAHTFASTPLNSIRALMNLRSKGIDFTSTHMGKLLHGRLLSERDFND